MTKYVDRRNRKPKEDMLLAPEEIRKLLRNYFDTFPKFEDRMDSENLGSLIENSAKAQLAEALKRLWEALEQSRKGEDIKGEDIDLPEEEFELFYSIRNDGIADAFKQDPACSEVRLMKVLVDGDIVRKDATPTYSELLATVAQLVKQEPVCPDCKEGYRTANDGTVSTCFTCAGTGKHSSREKIAEVIAEMMHDPPCAKGKCGHYDVQGHYCFKPKGQEVYCPMADQIIALKEVKQ